MIEGFSATRVYYLDKGAMNIEVVLSDGKTRKGYCTKVKKIDKPNIAELTIIVELDEVEK